MAFALKDEKQMEKIYDMCRAVYHNDLSNDRAVHQLQGQVEASNASLKMYFAIYNCMRRGKAYKMGTSETFTQFLLEHIYIDEGLDAFVTALSAVKGNAAYRESVNNAQPGLERACINAIKASGEEIEFEDIPFADYQPASSSPDSKGKKVGTKKMTAIEISSLQNSSSLRNADFAKTIMGLAEIYQFLSEEDIELLSNRSACSEKFSSDYAFLLSVKNNEEEIDKKIRDNTGRVRYYKNPYLLNGNYYVFTSQLYGPGGTHRDNRTPFLKWIIEKASSAQDPESPIDPHPTGHFDSWEIIDEYTAIKTCDKSFFEHNGSGVPRDICWFFSAEHIPSGASQQVTVRFEGNEYTAKIRNDSTDRRRIQILWTADLGKLFKRFAETEHPKAKFSRISEAIYEVSFENGGEEELTVKETISRIKAYIEAKGFSYQEGLIENFYLSLKSKPFVILAGTSGTGKTRLVKLFAEAVGANIDNGRYKMVPVRPDWSDSSDLFGHVDLNGKFVPGAIIDFVKRAELDSTKPYFLCLDEMNLARVEYYLSDFLSVIETRRYDGSRIISETPLVSGNYYSGDHAAEGKYGIVPFPENLYVIGTVNMDETTFPFSRKVLDRANTIEFSFVDLMPPAEWTTGLPAPLNLGNDFLKTEYLLLAQCADDQEAVNGYCLELQRLNRILQQANAHVGYRVRDEVVFYLLNNKTADLLPENEAIDNGIMQKILPRIQGSSASIKNMLCELFRVCAGDYEGQNTESDLSSKMLKVAQRPDCKYAKSAQKIAFMVRRFEEDGFTSYWL